MYSAHSACTVATIPCERLLGYGGYPFSWVLFIMLHWSRRYNRVSDVPSHSLCHLFQDVMTMLSTSIGTG